MKLEVRAFQRTPCPSNALPAHWSCSPQREGTKQVTLGVKTASNLIFGGRSSPSPNTARRPCPFLPTWNPNAQRLGYGSSLLETRSQLSNFRARARRRMVMVRIPRLKDRNETTARSPTASPRDESSTTRFFHWNIGPQVSVLSLRLSRNG